MADQLSGFWALHALARARGDGLKPELAALMGASHRAARAGAVPLQTQLRASGPAAQPLADPDPAAPDDSVLRFPDAGLD